MTGPNGAQPSERTGLSARSPNENHSNSAGSGQHVTGLTAQHRVRDKPLQISLVPRGEQGHCIWFFSSFLLAHYKSRENSCTVLGPQSRRCCSFLFFQDCFFSRGRPYLAGCLHTLEHRPVLLTPISQQAIVDSDKMATQNQSAGQRIAIVSVYDKTGLLDLAKGLVQQNVRILASGGTSKMIRESGFPVE